MNINRDLDDFDPDEWGNVKLPGMSDEKLHSTNWTKVSAAKNATRARKLLQEKDPEAYRQKLSAISKKVFEDPAKRHNHKKRIEQLNNDPVYRANVTIARKKEAQSESGRKRRSIQAKKFLQTEKGKKINEIRSKRMSEKAKPLISEFGVFRSVNLLCDFILKNNLFVNNTNKQAIGHKIRKLIKDNPANYFYISSDEYELCLLDRNQIDILKSNPVRRKLQIQADKKLAKEKIIAKQNQKKIKNNKPIIVPWGIYSSRKDACNAAIKMNIEGNLIYKIAKGLKQNPEKYRYITQEEYIMMTGKEI